LIFIHLYIIIKISYVYRGHENVEIVLNNKSQCARWEKDFEFMPVINTKYLLHWSKLKTKREYRTKFIKVKCDDCEEIFERRIRDLDPIKNYHLCSKCKNKGQRNGKFGISPSEHQKLSHKTWMEKNGNPFTWESSKEKIKEKQGWLRRGIKLSDETRKRMSLSAIDAFKNGRRKPNSGWGNAKIRQYKDIDYQSSYELKFLKYVESIGKMDLIERGPRISYKDLNEKEHNYYIDYKIKDTDIVFEIKSDYLWNKNKEINEIKMKEAEKQFQYHLIVNNNFEKIKNIFI